MDSTNFTRTFIPFYTKIKIIYCVFFLFLPQIIFAQKHFKNVVLNVNQRDYAIQYIVHPPKKLDKKHHEKQGKKVVKKEYVTFHLQTATEKDSIIKTTFKGKPKVGYTYTDDHPYANRGFIDEMLRLLHLHDSATFIVPVAFLYDALKKNPPKFLKNTQNIKYTIKVLDIRNIEQVEAEKNQILFDKQKRDNAVLAQYVAKNPSPLWKKTYSGVWYQMINEGIEEFPVKGDVVSVMYKAYNLENQDQEYASSEQDGRNLEFPIGKKFVMPFLDEVMFLMKKGARAKFYIPAHLAHDEMSVSETADKILVPPNTCVMWQIDLVDIIAHQIVIENKGEILAKEKKEKEKKEAKNKPSPEERAKQIEKEVKKKMKN